MQPTIIFFSGGGSSGHLMPSLAVADALMKKNPTLQPVFLCSSHFTEIDALRAFGQQHIVIHAGKFPRGWSIRLLTFPPLFVVSFFESIVHLLRLRPALIVSKGGFVSVPVCVAGFLFRIPIVLHSSDSVPSLSDRIIGHLARKICTGFPTSSFPASLQKKALQTGNPIRSSILRGSRSTGLRITGFSGKRPILMIIGGSQGSVALNEAVSQNFTELLDFADIIHLTGQGKSLPQKHARYFSRASVLDELSHLYACSDLIITRAGAGVLSEIAALKKAAIVVPLPGVAHDHQIRNAEFLAERQAVEFLSQDRLSDLAFVVRSVLGNEQRRSSMTAALHGALPAGATEKVTAVILDEIRVR